MEVRAVIKSDTFLVVAVLLLLLLLLLLVIGHLQQPLLIGQAQQA